MSPVADTIALVAPRYAPAIGGVERVVEMGARGLAERGVDVDIITTDPTGRLPRLEVRDKVAVRRFGTVANDAVYFVSPGLGLWLLRHAARYALIHVHSYHTPLLIQAALASRRAGLPLVVTPHYHGTGHSPVRRALHGPYRPIGHWALRQATRIICVSEVERALLEGHFGPHLPIVVIPNGVEVDTLAPARRTSPTPSGSRSDRLRVLSVGRLAAYKQPDRALRALPHLPPGTELMVVGDGPELPTLQRLASALGVAKRSHIVGGISHDRLLAAYRDADVAVSMSLHEAFGLAVLEAAVAGLPVVASDIPAHREIASYVPSGRVAFVEPDCPPSTLARAVEAAARVGRVDDVKRWPLPTWARHVDSVAACYEQVVSSRRPGEARIATA